MIITYQYRQRTTHADTHNTKENNNNNNHKIYRAAKVKNYESGNDVSS